MSDKRFVYILRSDAHPNRHYTGVTGDVEGRLYWHNSGPSGVTVHHRPWSLVVSLAFADAKVASAVRALSEDRIGAGVREAALRTDHAAWTR